MTKISIIIATRNRGGSLKKILDSLLSQKNDGSFEFEVIVVDNNSTDGTKATVESYLPKFNEATLARLKYLFEPIKGKSCALNKGIKEAQGDITAFTDDDVVVDSQWLSQIVRCLEQYPCDGVGGRILPFYPKETPQWITDNKHLLSGPIVFYDQGELSKKYEKPMLEFLGANFAFRREVFNQCGLFRTDLGPGTPRIGEDTEFVNRLLKEKKVLYYCGNALVWHPVDVKRMNLRYIAKWNITLGRYRVLGDDQGKIPEHLTYYFGVPRYLINEIMHNGLRAITTIFNKPEFLKAWKQLFINLGKAMEIRRIYSCTKSA